MPLGGETLSRAGTEKRMISNDSLYLVPSLMLIVNECAAGVIGLLIRSPRGRTALRKDVFWNFLRVRRGNIVQVGLLGLT